MQPENLLLDVCGNLKISDFGLSALSQQVKVMSRRYKCEYYWKWFLFLKASNWKFMGATVFSLMWYQNGCRHSAHQILVMFYITGWRVSCISVRSDGPLFVILGENYNIKYVFLVGRWFAAHFMWNSKLCSSRGYDGFRSYLMFIFVN